MNRIVQALCSPTCKVKASGVLGMECSPQKAIRQKIYSTSQIFVIYRPSLEDFTSKNDE